MQSAGLQNQEHEECCLWEIIHRSNEFSGLNRWRKHLERAKEKINKLIPQVQAESPGNFVQWVAQKLGVHQREDIKQLLNFAQKLPHSTTLENFLNELIETKDDSCSTVENIGV